MTKEEIRQKHLLKNGLFANKGSVGKAIQKAAHDAMDEYAKEVFKDGVALLKRAYRLNKDDMGFDVDVSEFMEKIGEPL